MKEVFERSWLEVNLDMLRDNYNQILSDVNSEVKLLCVVKADSYGLGSVQIARELQALGAYGFAVATAPEAVKLRENGITEPIVVLGCTLPKYAELLVQNDIIQTIVSLEIAMEFDRELKRLGKTLKCHIALDTGMGRIGFRAITEDDIKNTSLEIKALNQLSSIKICGIFTHFCQCDIYSELPSDYTQMQFSRYIKAVNEVEKLGVDLGLRHACNSAGIINHSSMHLHAVRPGVTLYGISPGDEMRVNRSYKYIASLKSKVVQVRKILKGEFISYSRTYCADHDMTTAVIPIGYADGYPRSLSNKGYVLIHGMKAPIVGRVCMDQTIVDVSHIENVVLGDEVVLYGTQKEAELSIREVASLALTIEQEIVCGINMRVPRAYLKDGKVVSVCSLL